MNCPSCGATVGPNDRFCMQCGAGLGAGPDVADGAVGPEDAHTPDPNAVTDLAMPVPASPLDIDLVACPACGASNAARRRRCGRCAGPLRPSEGPSTPPASPAVVPDVVPEPAAVPEAAVMSTPAPTPPTHRMRRSVIAMVVVGGIVAGGGVGLAAGLGIGPFGQGSGVTFDRQAYLAAPVTIPQVNVVASATRPAEGGMTWVPALTKDEDPSTAWQAPVAEGTVELHARFLNPAWVREIEVVNGDQSSSESFGSTARVHHAEVAIGHDLVLDVTLLDVPGTQIISLPEPALTEEITWVVDGWYGDPPLALSEVRYRGWVADEDDRAAFRGG